MTDGGTTDVNNAPTQATVARIYDYFLGGTHNFPADREAAEAMVRMFPLTPALARTNRAFLRRAVRYLAEAGVRQFLDLGSGIPTVRNVHEVADEVDPRSRVVYVDLDPVAVSEGQAILRGNERATAVQGNLLSPQDILDDPQIRQVLDLEQPVALILCAILHFVPDDEVAYDVVRHLLAALAPGSYLVVSHISMDGINADTDPADVANVDVARDLYRERTAMPFHFRTRAQVEQFFAGLTLVEPGVVWLPQWRPNPDEPGEFADSPINSVGLAGVGRLGGGDDREG